MATVHLRTAMKPLACRSSFVNRFLSNNFRKRSSLRVLQQHRAASSDRQRLVVLGTGWGSYSVLKFVDKKLFDVIVVSPRNHFLFTPLLCSTTVGTLEFRSIIEPVRNTGFRDEHHFQLAEAVALHQDEKKLVCVSTLNNEAREFYYDKLVIGVGAVGNTFGVSGVFEHAFFLKEIADARKIRNQILKNFELAMQPGISMEDKKQLLHFVIVGGGPTGVEFGAELYDFMKQDVTRLYSHEREHVRVTLIEARHILPSFDERLRHFAEKKIKQRKQFNLIQNSVAEVCSDHVKLQDGAVVPCGLVVWSTGLAPRPFVGKQCTSCQAFWNFAILQNQPKTAQDSTINRTSRNLMKSVKKM